MSREEKLQAIQDLMMESKDVYTLKELEKDVPKKKGINSMQVKDVLQELCDCDMISFDKIGSGNFYWCFPSEALNRRKVQEAKITAEIQAQEEELANLEKEIRELEPGREPSPERDQLDQEIGEFQRQIDEIHKEAAKYKQWDPETLKKLQHHSEIALIAANRWTDNICSLRSYCEKQFGKPKKEVNQIFDIPEDFDYLT